jgi:copper chaperone CopZ
LETNRFGIAGMTCDGCVQRIEGALRKVNGVSDVKVDRQSATATVTFDRAQTDMPALHDAVLKAGYTPSAVPQR